MHTHHTLDEAFEILTYTTKLIGIKGKLSTDFLDHDCYLNYLLENVKGPETRKLIDLIHSRVNGDFFHEYAGEEQS